MDNLAMDVIFDKKSENTKAQAETARKILKRLNL